MNFRLALLLLTFVAGLALAALKTPAVTAQNPDVIPHGQLAPPGPPLSPAEAVRKMTVPEGFTVELVAAEPDIVNPVSMTFDERGRIWITESIEYPRHSEGPGRDRIKVLESTKGNGIFDRTTIFAEGLNIPSGIAVGHGGIWVANAPDILFYKEGPDGKAVGKPEVVCTGFGRFDTHELPNSLTWGPDGWLYGLNGVFNPSRVKSNNGKEYKFTCALFRIHPKTHEFQLFCEGTSNPWGVAIDHDGSFFVSACVIDHLWHLTETGYYQRQGGAYPPFTWKLGSIVKHKHQKAAYCGINYFDSDAYPPEYRDKLYMGNIHGDCINCDEVTRDGSTYFGTPRPDFLTANDPWFMPIAQKTGPDGCLYVLDWYDRYHCYQDANRDPAGIDRGRGRLYRVRYKHSPPAGSFNLNQETDEQLIQRLHSPNVFFRDLAQRILTERDHPESRILLERLVLDETQPRKARMHGLWSLIGTGRLDLAFHLRILESQDSSYRAWSVRAAGNFGRVDERVRAKVALLANDPAPDVKLQVAIAARKVQGIDAMPVLLQTLATCGDDKLIPPIVWQNLQPLMEQNSARLITHLEKSNLKATPNLGLILPRIIDRLLSGQAPDHAAICKLLVRLADSRSGAPDACSQCLAVLANKVQTGEIAAEHHVLLCDQLRTTFDKILAGPVDQPLYLDTALLAASLKQAAGVAAVHQVFIASNKSETIRLRALMALVAADDRLLLDLLEKLLADRSGSASFRGQALSAIDNFRDPRVADVVLAHYARLEPEVQQKAIDLLTRRADWSRPLLARIARKEISPAALNVNQVKKMLASRDPEIVRQVTALWGTLREERNPDREKVVAEMRNLLRTARGNPVSGRLVFKNLCAQCHKLHSEGQEVGPDLTSNGRNNYEQLLSNVFDPSLVIGAGYAGTTVATKRGLVFNGILAEDNSQRVVLKLQGGKLETIPRADIDEMTTSKISLMPEGLERQLKPQEIADLFSFLLQDKPR